MRDLYDKCLAIVSGQKHDFLNYLQVISGFIQLGKKDEALKYLRESIVEINRDGVVTKLRDSQLAFQLLLLSQRAKANGVEWEISVSQEVQQAQFTQQVAQSIYRSLDEAISTLSDQASSGGAAAISANFYREGELVTVSINSNCHLTLSTGTLNQLRKSGFEVTTQGNTIKLEVTV